MILSPDYLGHVINNLFLLKKLFRHELKLKGSKLCRCRYNFQSKFRNNNNIYLIKVNILEHGINLIQGSLIELYTHTTVTVSHNPLHKKITQQIHLSFKIQFYLVLKKSKKITNKSFPCLR